MIRFKCIVVFALIVAATMTLCLPAFSKPPKVHPRPFGRGHAYVHISEIAPYRFEKQTITARFNFTAGTLDAVTTSVIVAKHGGLRRVPFDSVGLQYHRVTLNGAPVRYNVTPGRLYVQLPAPAASGTRMTIAAEYSASPTRGVYFIRPDRFYPHYQPEIWTQGEAEDNRRWFPTWDEPNEKTPSELVISVPHGWTVIGNGSLVSHRDDGRWATWDWLEPHPHSTYLTAFVAGPYVKLLDALGTLPVNYYVSPADAKLGRLCFGETPAMIAFFQEKIGIPFPWEKYAQTAVERFTAGGMENASATTETETAIHPPAAELTNSCQGLVSHELSHQWWGDDVTAVDWPNIWINEGFATYFQELWFQHHFGEAEFQYQRYHAQQSYFDETKRYWRPIVDNDYAVADDLFDASGYPRPAQVLHMLRYVLGEHAFWTALHDYLSEYQWKNADTRQFESAVEKSSGRNLRWFFDEWFYRPAYPNFAVAQRYDKRHKVLVLDIRQRNHDGRPFTMPIAITIQTSEGTRTVHFSVHSLHQTLSINGINALPQMVLFDPDDNVLRKLTFPKTLAELRYQAQNAPSVSDRLWAIDQLGKTNGKDRDAARPTVRDAIAHDAFYGVRVDALDAATSLDDPVAVDLALNDRDTRVVVAAGNAVADLPHPAEAALIADLKRLATSSSPVVAGAALHGLGATRTAGVYALLAAALHRHVFREYIARGALAGFGELQDLRAVPLIESRAAYGVDELERQDALRALGEVAKKQPAAVVGFLSKIASTDRYFRARTAAIRALGKLGDPAAIPALQRVENTDTEEGVRNNAWDAVADIRDAVKAKQKEKTAAR